MTAKTFEECWKFVFDRSQRGVLTVQDPVELKHIFELMRSCDCSSYLEIGAAEGNSLYVLGHAVKQKIHCIDFGEKHTSDYRHEVMKLLQCDAISFEPFSRDRPREIAEFIGDSTISTTFGRGREYDCILIDGGHDFATVLSDSILYAPLATKYVFWHDIQLPEVRAAYEWFKKRWALGEYSEFIASDSFGYGILKVKS